MPEAIVLGGNGLVGAAVALRLAADGWQVTSSGRSADRFPPELREAGVRFGRSDRYAAGDLRELLHPGADAVVDCVGYTAAHARMLLPFRQGIGSLVFISSKAVYIDGHGRHSNSDEPPDFTLDTSAAQRLGFVPVGSYAETVKAEVDWLVRAARSGDLAGTLPSPDEPYFRAFFDYAREDAWLDERAGAIRP